MSNVNDNNLDDLLRRAAERYPLRTDSANWERMASDLEKDPSLILPPVNAEEGRRKRRFFWLFFLLPLAGVGYYTWHATGRSGLVARHAIEANDPVKTSGQVDKGSPSEKVSPVGTSTSVEKGGPEEKSKPGEKGSQGEKTSPGEKSSAVNGTAGKVQQQGEVQQLVEGRPAGEKAERAPGANGKSVEDAGGKGVLGANGKTFPGVNGKRVKGAGGKDQSESEDLPRGSNTDLTASVSSIGHTPQPHSRLGLASLKGDVTVNIPVRARTTIQAKDSSTKKDKIKPQKPKPSFYVGILGSPDLSTIRFQSVKTVGSNWGLLLGYSFNSRWSIETGLFYDRKKYYTDGEYFSKAKVPPLQYVDLHDVNGVCSMWEIPLNVRYNFSRNEKNKWFATAGFSNYLMTKETYSFSGTYWGGPYDKTWAYKTPYHYWFSIVDLSVGYEQRLGKIGNLRLEPYLRVPMSGIGTGSLSIMSAGLNIGITRKIW